MLNAIITFLKSIFKSKCKKRYFLISYNYSFDDGRLMGFNELTSIGVKFPSREAIVCDLKKHHNKADLVFSIFSIFEMSESDHKDWSSSSESNTTYSKTPSPPIGPPLEELKESIKVVNNFKKKV